MSKMDRQFHKQARFNILPKDTRFTTKVNDKIKHSIKDNLEEKEAIDQMTNYNEDEE